MNGYNDTVNLDYLEHRKSEMYQDCCFYNDCGICPHKNEGTVCDLIGITRIIEQMEKSGTRTEKKESEAK